MANHQQKKTRARLAMKRFVCRDVLLISMR